MDRFTVVHEHSYDLDYEGNFKAGHINDYVKDTETGQVWEMHRVVEWMNGKTR